MADSTPGPWRREMDRRGHWEIFAPTDAMICRIARWTAAIDAADAHLIAASPTLLAALQNVVDSAVTDSDTCPMCRADVTRHVPDCAIVIALAAIATAEGR